MAEAQVINLLGGSKMVIVSIYEGCQTSFDCLAMQAFIKKHKLYDYVVDGYVSETGLNAFAKYAAKSLAPRSRKIDKLICAMIDKYNEEVTDAN